MRKFNILKQFINTIRHSERSEESRHYVRNSFGLLARKLGCFSGLPCKVNLARNDGRAGILGCLQSNYAHRNWILRSLTLPQNDGQWKSAINKKISFTMAEILLSLTIIGVVAAITLPSLTGNINERTWNTQRKALYARMSQAIALMSNLNGYGIGATEAQTNSIAAKVFITDGLSKVLKINNVCDSDHLSDCGIASKITTMGESPRKINVPKTLYELHRYAVSASSYSVNSSYTTSGYSLTNTKAASFETVNGESVLLYYQPLCQPNLNQSSQHVFYAIPMVCANFVYDLNGKKGPNTVGKDIGFITALYATDSVVVSAIPYQNDAKNPENGSYYITQNPTELRYTACKQHDEDAKVPNIEEAAALIYNHSLAGILEGTTTAYFYLTTKPYYKYTVFGGFIGVGSHATNYRVRCIKR